MPKVMIDEHLVSMFTVDMPDPNGLSNLAVLSVWPRFEDGSPVMWGDFVTSDDLTGEVTMISFDEDGYEIVTTEFDMERKFDETVTRGHDSMDLIWTAARDAMNAHVLSRELFERLCERARKLGDAS